MPRELPAPAHPRLARAIDGDLLGRGIGEPLRNRREQKPQQSRGRAFTGRRVILDAGHRPIFFAIRWATPPRVAGKPAPPAI